MLYKFKCKCGNTEERDIPIKDYTEQKDKQFCSKCESKMERIIEWEGPATINGGYESVGGRAKWQ